MARLLTPRATDLGGFRILRALPRREQKMVGPFIFLDHMGPVEFAPGRGADIRPHPHIGLCTLSYLFSGSLLHRDSLGRVQEIHPGDVNWMTAGRGIVHSERESLEARTRRRELHGLQFWVALPKPLVDIAPDFAHCGRNSLPHVLREGVSLRLIAGEAYGRASPLRTYSPLFLLDGLLRAGARLEHPSPGWDAALYVIQGQLRVDGMDCPPRVLLVLEDGEPGEITALEDSRVILLGGQAFPTTPRMLWNFVAYERERLEAAARRWEAGGFPEVPGDGEEREPLPTQQASTRSDPPTTAR